MVDELLISHHVQCFLNPETSSQWLRMLFLLLFVVGVLVVIRFSFP